MLDSCVTNRRLCSGAYINKREVTSRFRVKPGQYLLIPSTYDADREGQFLLRIFTEGGSTGKSIEMTEPNLVSDPGQATSNLHFHSQGPSSPTTPKELYEYKDGQGRESKFTPMQWYDRLPPSQRNLIK